MARSGFIFHFSNLGNIKMMLESGESDSALDAIIKAIEFDMSDGKVRPGFDEFITPGGVFVFNSLIGQIEVDKAKYKEVCEERKQSGKQGGKPKEFLPGDVQTLVNELHASDGLSDKHFKEVRKDDGGVPVYSFVDKKTERLYLQKSKLFNNNGTRKKR